MAEFPASLLILNGKSTDNLPLREAIMLLREEGMTIHVRVTWEKGDAARYVEEARKLGVATVIAGGGDGTRQPPGDGPEEGHEIAQGQQEAGDFFLLHQLPQAMVITHVG